MLILGIHLRFCAHLAQDNLTSGIVFAIFFLDRILQKQQLLVYLLNGNTLVILPLFIVLLHFFCSLSNDPPEFQRNAAFLTADLIFLFL